jgi:hypothetical protein
MKTNAAKIRAHFESHPNAKAADVAKKFGTTPAYVYIVRSKMRSKADKESWAPVHVSTSNESAKPAAPAPAATTDVDATLAERGKRYGTFKGHAEVTYRLKNVLRDHADKHDKTFAFDQAEAIDMICHKLGRIVNGDPNYADSWIDIAGYAKLVADRLEGKEV